MKWLLWLLLISLTNLIAEDKLTVTMEPADKTYFDGTQKLNLCLKLSTPADRAFVTFTAAKGQRLIINGSETLDLHPNHTHNVFKGTIPRFDSWYSPALYNGWTYGKGHLTFTPVVIRAGNVSNLTSQSLSTPCRLPVKVQMTARQTRGRGKFGTSLALDGQVDMAAFQRTAFNPYEGSMEVWLYLPVLLPSSTGIVWFLQRADSGPWSYQQLAVPANTRKLAYTIYSAQKGFQTITSDTVNEEAFVHVGCTWSMKNKRMELWINGNLAGTAPYEVPCGGPKAELTLGARIHHGKEGMKVIGNLSCLIDELRLSSCVRKPRAMNTPYSLDSETVLILHFDDPFFLGAMLQNSKGKRQ